MFQGGALCEAPIGVGGVGETVSTAGECVELVCPLGGRGLELPAEPLPGLSGVNLLGLAPASLCRLLGNGLISGFAAVALLRPQICFCPGIEGSSLRATEHSREIVCQGTRDGSRARWNHDHSTENIAQHPVTPSRALCKSDVTIPQVWMSKHGPEP